MKKVVAAIGIIIVIILVGLGLWYFTSSSASYSGTPDPITIGELPFDYDGLIYVAQDQGFFAENGLNATVRYYNSSVGAINGLSNDEVDMAVSSEYVFVRQALNKVNISTIGSIDKYQTVYLIGRNDKGIVNVSDLKGKKIGLSRGTIGEFYLGRFLDLNGLSIQDVTLVDMPTTQYANAITNGSVDAVITSVYIDQIQEQLGDNAVSWPAQSSQNAFGVMTSRDDWIASHPEQINRLLKSLDQAEQYSIDHPAESKSIIQKGLNYTDAYMASDWPNQHYALSLDQSLVLAMQDEGRWMIANNLTTAKTIPDYRNYIYTNGMQNIKPEAVNIIG
jgi:NitT/TauT family transport system substrate-binding protein